MSLNAISASRCHPPAARQYANKTLSEPLVESTDYRLGILRGAQLHGRATAIKI